MSLNQNKSPVIHVEHNLGIESWCVKHVYSYAYKKILEVRKLVSKRKLLHEEYNAVNRLILGALLINPDVSTFWNMRRELVTDNLIPMKNELRITKIVLSHKSKSNEAFAYRKWLLRRIFANEILDKSNMNLLLNEEMKVCNMTALKSPNNYHSWCHRIWCMEKLLNVASDEFCADMLMIELCYTEMWVSKHVSEHTGFHYRQYVMSKVRHVQLALDDNYKACMKRFFTNSADVTNVADVLKSIFGNSEKSWTDVNLRLLYQTMVVLLYDLLLNTEHHDIFPEHETLWCHRRYILYNLFHLIFVYLGASMDNSTNLHVVFTNDKPECNVVDNVVVKSIVCDKFWSNGEKFPKILKCDKSNIYSSKMYKTLLSTEKTLIDKYSKVNNRHGYLAQRHEKWLVYILGLSSV